MHIKFLPEKFCVDFLMFQSFKDYISFLRFRFSLLLVHFYAFGVNTNGKCLNRHKTDSIYLEALCKEPLESAKSLNASKVSCLFRAEGYLSPFSKKGL